MANLSSKDLASLGRYLAKRVWQFFVIIIQTTHDLQNSFLALATDPESQMKLKFFEEKVRSWVFEVIQGNDGLSVQANILGKRVDGLVRGINEPRPEEK